MAGQKSAYEIRSDLLRLATEIVRDNNFDKDTHRSEYTIEDVLDIAKELNKFVSEQQKP